MEKIKKNTPKQFVTILRQIEGGCRKRQDDAGERAWKPKITEQDLLTEDVPNPSMTTLVKI